MEVDCPSGLMAASKYFDNIEYGSHVHISYKLAWLCSTRFQVQFQLVQLRHRIFRFRSARIREGCKQNHEENLSELLHTRQ